MIKQIQGKNMGYLEVQQDVDKVREKLRAADEDLHVCLIDDEGELLYWNTRGGYGFFAGSCCAGTIYRRINTWEATGRNTWWPASIMRPRKPRCWFYKDSSLIRDDVGTYYQHDRISCGDPAAVFPSCMYLYPPDI